MVHQDHQVRVRDTDLAPPESAFGVDGNSIPVRTIITIDVETEHSVNLRRGQRSVAIPGQEGASLQTSLTAPKRDRQSVEARRIARDQLIAAPAVPIYIRKSFVA